MKECVSVIGLGRVGLPLALFIAEKGFKVVGIDINEEKCKEINNKKNPLPDEPGVDELMEKHVGKNFSAFSDFSALSKCKFHIIIVPLFLTKEKFPDFSAIRAASVSLGKHLKRGDIVVVETTLPPLTTETKIKEWVEESSGLKVGEFYLAHSPERIAAGKVLDRLENFPKIIGGVDKESGRKAFEFYKQIIPNLSLVSSARVAEMAKVMEGVYRDVNIGLANQLYMIAEELGIDFFEARKAANHDYCHIHLPSVGVGGHCIPVYPWFLIREMEMREKYSKASMMYLGRKINDEMVHYWKKKLLEAALRIGEGKKVVICIKGVSFRKGIKSPINSRSIALYHELKKEKYILVGMWDELYGRKELEEMGIEAISPEEADVIFDAYELKIKVGKSEGEK